MRASATFALCLFALASRRAAANPSVPAAAQASAAPTPPTHVQFDLRGGLGIRNDSVLADGARASARGGTLSVFSLSGAWFAARSSLGVAGGGELDRFALRARDAAGPALTATGFEATGALAARMFRAGGRLELGGRVGYGLVQVPLVRPEVPGAAPVLLASLLRAHGPVAGAHAALAVTDALSLEAQARFIPLTFAGRFEERSMHLWRLGAGVGATFGRLQLGGVQLDALVGYEYGATSADGPGVEIRQRRHQLALGLRATPARPRLPAPALAATAPERGRIGGVIRSDPSAVPPGQPLAGVTVACAGGPSTTTGADGRFHLEDLPPGLVTLTLSRADLAGSTEIISVPAGAPVALELVMQAAAAPAPTVVMGFVRGEDGSEVTARVRLTGPGVALSAETGGHFQFKVPAGQYTLTIDAAGFVAQRKNVVARAGEHNIYDVDLQGHK